MEACERGHFGVFKMATVYPLKITLRTEEDSAFRLSGSGLKRQLAADKGNSLESHSINNWDQK